MAGGSMTDPVYAMTALSLALTASSIYAWRCREERLGAILLALALALGTLAVGLAMGLGDLP